MQEQWQQALEEFGDEAFRRFKPKWPLQAGCNDNHDIIIGLNSGLCFELKPLPELFADDVDVYGKDAYLMWEYQPGIGSDYNFENFDSNDEVLNSIWELNNRKESAALPFDLELAKTGECFEFYDNGSWCDAEISDFSDEESLTIFISSRTCYVDNPLFSNLRMKYPPKQESQNE